MLVSFPPLIYMLKSSGSSCLIRGPISELNLVACSRREVTRGTVGAGATPRCLPELGGLRPRSRISLCFTPAVAAVLGRYRLVRVLESPSRGLPLPHRAGVWITMEAAQSSRRFNRSVVLRASPAVSSPDEVSPDRVRAPTSSHSLRARPHCSQDGRQDSRVQRRASRASTGGVPAASRHRAVRGVMDTRTGIPK